MSLIEQSLADFGNQVGISNLGWNPSNLAVLQFERSGTLRFQSGMDAVQISLTRTYPFISVAQLRIAFELCHWQNNFPFPVRAGLVREENLVFAIEFLHRDFVVTNIHRAFDLLCRLHEEVSGA